jgi:hypothetical protein
MLASRTLLMSTFTRVWSHFIYQIDFSLSVNIQLLFPFLKVISSPASEYRLLNNRKRFSLIPIIEWSILFLFQSSNMLIQFFSIYPMEFYYDFFKWKISLWHFHCYWLLFNYFSSLLIVIKLVLSMVIIQGHLAVFSIISSELIG